jgi:hypothetical protein
MHAISLMGYGLPSKYSGFLEGSKEKVDRIMILFNCSVLDT